MLEARQVISEDGLDAVRELHWLEADTNDQPRTPTGDAPERLLRCEMRHRFELALERLDDPLAQVLTSQLARARRRTP